MTFKHQDRNNELVLVNGQELRITVRDQEKVKELITVKEQDRKELMTVEDPN